MFFAVISIDQYLKYSSVEMTSGSSTLFVYSVHNYTPSNYILSMEHETINGPTHTLPNLASWFERQ